MTTQATSPLSGIETDGVLSVWPPKLPPINEAPEISLSQATRDAEETPPVMGASESASIMRSVSAGGWKSALVPAALTSVAVHGLVWAMLATAPAKQIGDPAEEAVSVEIVQAPLPDTAAGEVTPTSAESIPFEPQQAFLNEPPQLGEYIPELPELAVLQGAPDIQQRLQPAQPPMPEITQHPEPAGPPSIDMPEPEPPAYPELPAPPQLSALAGPPDIKVLDVREPDSPVSASAPLPSPRPEPDLATQKAASSEPEIQAPEAEPSQTETADISELPKTELSFLPVPEPRPEPPERAHNTKTEKAKREAPAAPKKVAPAKKAKTASTASAGQPASKASAAEKNRYGRKLARHVQRHKSYPSEAKRKRIAGAAQLTITIGRSGGLAGARLSGSSGHTILDKEALAIARRASPYPKPPESFGGSNFTFAVTLRFGR